MRRCATSVGTVLRGAFGRWLFRCEQQFPGPLVNPGAVGQAAEPTLDQDGIHFVDQLIPAHPSSGLDFVLVHRREVAFTARRGLGYHDMSGPL